jgi:hypothetical protein
LARLPDPAQAASSRRLRFRPNRKNSIKQINALADREWKAAAA